MFSGICFPQFEQNITFYPLLIGTLIGHFKSVILFVVPTFANLFRKIP